MRDDSTYITCEVEVLIYLILVKEEYSFKLLVWKLLTYFNLCSFMLATDNHRSALWIDK
jgi:hypothetical protein